MIKLAPFHLKLAPFLYPSPITTFTMPPPPCSTFCMTSIQVRVSYIPYRNRKTCLLAATSQMSGNVIMIPVTVKCIASSNYHLIMCDVNESKWVSKCHTIVVFENIEALQNCVTRYAIYVYGSFLEMIHIDISEKWVREKEREGERESERNTSHAHQV